VRRIARELRAVCFNGKTAGRAQPAWAAAGYETIVMPSTSPAYTLPFAEKLAQWQALAGVLADR
jgi:G:T/U-mismatch repair DNA glycosylase